MSKLKDRIKELEQALRMKPFYESCTAAQARKIKELEAENQRLKQENETLRHKLIGWEHAARTEGDDGTRLEAECVWLKKELERARQYMLRVNL